MLSKKINIKINYGKLKNNSVNNYIIMPSEKSQH